MSLQRFPFCETPNPGDFTTGWEQQGLREYLLLMPGNSETFEATTVVEGSGLERLKEGSLLDTFEEASRLDTLSERSRLGKSQCFRSGGCWLFCLSAREG